MKKVRMARALGYTLIFLGLVWFSYGLSEYKHTISSINSVTESMPEKILTDQTFQTLIGMTTNQTLSMNVLTYIAPAFMIIAMGILIILIDKILEPLQKFDKGIEELLKNSESIYNEDDKTVVATGEVNHEDPGGVR
jgi:hypothetical protein